MCCLSGSVRPCLHWPAAEREYNTTGLMLANGDLMCLMCENRFAWTSKQSEEGRGHSRKFRDF